MEKRAEELLIRAVDALESLAEEPSIEIPTSPPVCPHCAMLDPVVLVDESPGQEGNLSTYYMKATCKSCNQEFWVVPQGFMNCTSLEEVEGFLGRAENGTHGAAAN